VPLFVGRGVWMGRSNDSAVPLFVRSIASILSVAITMQLLALLWVETLVLAWRMSSGCVIVYVYVCVTSYALCVCECVRVRLCN